MWSISPRAPPCRRLPVAVEQIVSCLAGALAGGAGPRFPGAPPCRRLPVAVEQIVSCLAGALAVALELGFPVGLLAPPRRLVLLARRVLGLAHVVGVELVGAAGAQLPAERLERLLRPLGEG